MTPLEAEVLKLIRSHRGIKRINLRSKFSGKMPTFPYISHNELKMILAELVALGEIVELEYSFDGILDFFYIPGPTEIKIRGKGI